MNANSFDKVEQVLRSDGPRAGFDLLEQEFRAEKEYQLLFETLLMRKRHELGLPLIPNGPLNDLPSHAKRVYDEGFVEAARDVGNLFLAEGDIQRAWPYFRAIGETAPVAAAIEGLQPREGMDAIIEIAFFEGVHPHKGFAFILHNYGLCRAISAMAQYPGQMGRHECISLLVSNLHEALVNGLKRAIAEREGQTSDTQSVSVLIGGRDWLFEKNDYHIDTTHLVSILPFSIDLSEQGTLRLALELAEYGTHLAPLFQFRGNPPFQNGYSDYAIYLRALLGEAVEDAVAHFRDKITEPDANDLVCAPAQVLVGLLARLKRYTEAVEVSCKHLAAVDAAHLSCPSVVQLCQSAGDPGKLMQVARERRDLLSFAAGVLQT
jgi:hypothetical protein